MAWDPNATPWAWDAGALFPTRDGSGLCKQEESSETAISSSDGRLCSAAGLLCGGPPPRFHFTRVFVQCDNPCDGCPCSMSATQCDSSQTIITSSDLSCCSFPVPFEKPHATCAQKKPPLTMVTSSGKLAHFMVMEDETRQTVSSSIERPSSVAPPLECALTYPACLMPSSLALTLPPMIVSVFSDPVAVEIDVISNKCPTVDWNDPQQGHVLGDVMHPVAKTGLALSESHGVPSLVSDKLFAIDYKGPYMWKDPHTGHGPEDVAHPGTVKDRDAKLTKLTSHSLRQHQAAMCSTQMADKFCLTKQSECKSSTQPEQQRGVSLHAVQDVKDRYAVLSMDEQHSSTVTGSAGSGESLIGLHLGKRTYFQDAASATVTKATQKSRPASKKCRASAMQVPRCQVRGCDIELTSAKDYHQKHKVCESHSKAVKVSVANQEQRFCQQCSRFHLLAEFDGTKRSCRKRLAGHNERRRKPQPDPLALHASLQSSLQAWPFLHHSRVLGLPSLCQDRSDIRSSGSWQRTSLFEDRPSYLQAPNMELQLNSKGALYPTSSSRPHMLLQSPTEMMPIDISHSHANENYSLHQYLSELNGLVSNRLTLPPSSVGARVLSGYDATEMVARVTDSRRALSLLSPQTRGLYTPNEVSLDWLGGTNMGNDQFLNEENHPHKLILRGGQQHHYVCSPERSHFQASASSLPTDWISASEKNYLEVALKHGFDGALGVENHPLLAAFPEQDRSSSKDVKKTIDLMPILSSQSQHETTQGLSLPFQLVDGVFGDLHYSTYGSAF